MLAFPPLAGPGTVRHRLAGWTIHLWALRLDPPAERVEALARLLSADERRRAARFRFDVHRRRFTVGRGSLRRLLASYLDADPAGLRFTYGAKGKPALAAGAPGAGLEFNLSNSHELALVGLCRTAPLGVDVEHLRVVEDLRQIAARFFSRAESEVLLALDPWLQTPAFFNCWTRKEAYLKATGDGITAPLDRFDVTLVPGEPARMLSLEGDRERGAGWSLHHLEPAAGYVGAVAVEGGGWQLEGWTLAAAGGETGDPPGPS